MKAGKQADLVKQLEEKLKAVNKSNSQLHTKIQQEKKAKKCKATTHKRASKLDEQAAPHKQSMNMSSTHPSLPQEQFIYKPEEILGGSSNIIIDTIGSGSVDKLYNVTKKSTTFPGSKTLTFCDEINQLSSQDLDETIPAPVPAYEEKSDCRSRERSIGKSQHRVTSIERSI
jgi:hypothetical protein